MTKLYLIAGVLVLVIAVFYAGMKYDDASDKIAIAEEAARQAKVLVEAERKKWEREAKTKEVIKYVDRYVKANPKSCAGRPCRLRRA